MQILVGKKEKVEKNNVKNEQARVSVNSEVKKNCSLNILDSLISLSIFLIFFGTSLFFTGTTLQGIGFEKQIFFYAALLIGLTAWIFKGISCGEISIRRTPLDIPIVVALIVALLSTVFSVNRWDSFLGGFSIPTKGFLAILSLAAFYWFFISNANEKRIKIAFKALIGAITILAIFMTLKFTGLAEYLVSVVRISIPESLQFLMDKSFNPIGMLGNLGVVLGAGLLLIMSNGKKQEYGRFLKGLMAILILLLIYLTLALVNYTGMAILLVAFTLYIVFTISKVVPATRLFKGIAIFMFCAILLLMIMGGAFHPIKVSLPTEIGLGRRAAWSISSEAIKENWIVGTGLATFKYGFSKYRPQALNNSILWQTKFSGAGFFAEIPATGGIAGTLAAILLVLAFIGAVVLVLLGDNMKDSLASIQIGQSREIVSANTILSLFCASILIILYMIFNLSSTAVILFGIMVITLTMAAAAQARPNMFKEYKFSYHTSPQYALALSFAFMCIASGVIVVFALLGKMFVADVYAQKSVNADNFTNAAILMEQAAGLAAFQDEYMSRLGNMYLSDGIMEMQKSAPDKDKARDLFVNSLRAHRTVAVLTKNDPDRWESYAVAAETMSGYDPTMLDEAIEVYKKTVELNPLNPLLYTRLAKMQVVRGDYITTEKEKEMPIEKANLYNAAKDNYKKAIELRGDIADFYSSLALTQERMNEINKAMENFQKALILKPEDPTFLYQLGRLFEGSGSKEMGKQYYQKTLDALEAIPIPESGIDINAETKEALKKLINPSAQQITTEEGETVE